MGTPLANNLIKYNPVPAVEASPVYKWSDGHLKLHIPCYKESSLGLPVIQEVSMH